MSGCTKDIHIWNKTRWTQLERYIYPVLTLRETPITTTNFVVFTYLNSDKIIQYNLDINLFIAIWRKLRKFILKEYLLKIYQISEDERLMHYKIIKNN